MDILVIWKQSTIMLVKPTMKCTIYLALVNWSVQVRNVVINVVYSAYNFSNVNVSGFITELSTFDYFE